MEDEKLKDYVQKQLYKKGIDIKTQDYITDYIYMNQKLFGNILNTNKIVDRILNNLESSIKTFNTEKNLSLQQKLLLNKRFAGLYDADDKKILINPRRHIKSYVIEEEKKREKSTIMHEIDHAATTTGFEISEKEKDRYISEALKKHPVKDSKKEERIVNELNNRYEKNDGKVYVSGIFDPRYFIDNGINLRALNEGITAYKQELYDKFNGIKSKTGYKNEKKLAKHIADVIGKEELIARQFDGDYEGIRQTFNEKTGQDLNYFVKELNKGTLYKGPISKVMHNLVSKIKKYNSVQTLEPASNNTLNQPETLQSQLAKQVNTPKEVLMEDVEDVSKAINEKNLNKQELQKEENRDMVR